ncbi:MAG TPA: FAD-dependent oxidoreductase [Beijerinckiaceae bacterium]|nr:FAD-dependent oxidoreductase [Beijerinckiaceae bacterium]
MAKTAEFPRLFNPLKVGRRTLRNRVALPATLTNYGLRNRVTERWIDFLVERAKGGAGMIVTEIIAVDPAALAHGAIVTGYEAENEDGFRKTADGVEAAGACLIAQLWHPGRQQLWAPVMSPKGISDQPDAYSWTVPHVMDTDELRQVADEYVAVAQRLKSCGFHGAELHGAHGYLITQILSPWSNQRTDAYGGSLENRIRFVREVAQAIRETCGPDFVIGLKMPGDEGVAGGIDPDEAARITAALAADGVLDYFAYSQGNFSLSLENHVPDMHFRRGHFLDIHRKVRPAAAGIPVMAIGRISTPAEAEAAIADGAADFVGLTRALIADADWPNKAREGRFDAIRPSTYDNFAWGEVHAGKPLAEVHNPQIGREGESGWRAPRAEARRRIVVVGAGPAGLQSVRVAAERGHEVTLFSASQALGGKLRREAALPGGDEYGNLLAWIAREVDRAGVMVERGRTASVAEILALRPDSVIVATGSHQRRPDNFAGDGLSARDWAERPHDAGNGETAVLFDMDHSAGTYAVVDALAARHRRVVLLTPRTQIAKSVNYCSAIGVHRRLYEAEVEIVLAAEPVGMRDGLLTWRNVFTGRTTEIPDVRLLVWSTPRIADDAIAAPLRQAGIETRLVGDCMAPRNLMCAIHEGEAAALAV